jgi:hypothetical protein
MYLGSWKIDDVLTFTVNTTRFDTGVATDADAVPAYRIYENETGTAIVTGNMALLDSASTAGFYSEAVTLSAANGFEKGKCYNIYISAAVNSVTGTTSRNFQLEAEVDANIVSDKTGYALSAAGVDAVWDEAMSGHTTSGTYGQRLLAIRQATAVAGAAGTITLDASASATDDFYNNQVILVTSGTGAIQARAISDYVGSTKVATIVPNWVTTPSSDSVFAILPSGALAVATAAEIADAVWDETTSGHTTVATYGQRLQSIRTGTAQAGAAGTITLDSGASAVDDFYDGLILITAGTGAGQSRAITNYVGSTKLASVSPNWATTPGATSVFVVLPGASLPVATSAEVANEVWEASAAAHTTAGSTGEALDNASSAGDPWSTLIPASYTAGQAGYIIGNNINAPIATVDTVVDAIKLKTDALPSDPADASVVAGLIAALETKVDTIDGIVDSILVDTGTTLDDMVDDLETRLSAALTTKLNAHSAAVLVTVIDAGSSTTAVVLKTVEGAVPSATNDLYNGRVIYYTSGALNGQAVEITDYVGATKVATTTASTSAPAEDVTAIIA